MSGGSHATFLVWDDAGGLFLRAELTRGLAGPGATATVLCWVGARPAYASGLAVDDADDAGGPGSLAVGSLRAAEVGAGAWRLDLDDGPNRLALRFDAFTPAVRCDLPEWVAVAHDEWACRVTGSVELSGHLIDVDGVGQHRRSAGAVSPEHGATAAPTTGAGWRSATGYLGPSSRAVGAPATDLAFSAWEVAASEGRPASVHGFVHAGAADHRLVAVDTLDDGPLHLVLGADGDRRFTVRGHPHGAPVAVRPAGAGEANPSVVHLQLVRWEADGLDGYGLVERLESPPTTPG